MNVCLGVYISLHVCAMTQICGSEVNPQELLSL